MQKNCKESGNLLKKLRLKKLKSLNKVSVGKTSLCHKSTVLLLGFSRSTQIDHDRASQEKEILMMGSKAKLHGWVIDSQYEKIFDSHWEGYFISHSRSISLFVVFVPRHSYSCLYMCTPKNVFIHCFITNQIGCWVTCLEWSKIWLNNSWHCFHSFDI